MLTRRRLGSLCEGFNESATALPHAGMTYHHVDSIHRARAFPHARESRRNELNWRKAGVDRFRPRPNTYASVGIKPNCGRAPPDLPSVGAPTRGRDSSSRRVRHNAWSNFQGHTRSNLRIRCVSAFLSLCGFKCERSEIKTTSIESLNTGRVRTIPENRRSPSH